MTEIKKLNTGTISIAKNGFGFISTPNSESDYFVPKIFTNGALNLDEVEFETYFNESKQVDEAKVTKIVNRNTKHLVCKTTKRGKYLDFTPLNKKINNFIRVVNKSDFELLEENFYKLKILRVDEKGFLICLIVKHIGDVNLKGLDITALLEEYGARMHFSRSVIAQSDKIPAKVLQKDHKGRKDLRDLFTFTIDNDDSKDLDDAISIVKEGENYRLWVHIADVSYYVQEDTKLDQEAYKRGCSIYVADRVVPMLPSKLSNGICSLNEDVDRCALTCEMLIDKNANVIWRDLYPALIHSNYQMTYTNCNKILAGDHDLEYEFFEMVDPLLLVKELKGLLFKSRENKGSLTFEIDEGKIILDENGKAIDVELRKMGESNLIIEELMLIANQTVAEFMKKSKLPSIYRIHEFPSEVKIEQLTKTLNRLGYKISFENQEEYLFELQRIVENVKPKDRLVVSLMMLRSLEKARYDDVSTEHFALAADFYTHFTSPIRRYPDLLLHRLIRTFIFEKNQKSETLSHFKETIARAAVDNSMSERVAIDAERGVNDIKKAEIMKGKIGQRFKGIIVAVLKFGMFVELPNTIEGLVAYDTFTFDEFEYNPDLENAVGKKTKKVYKLGDNVEIEVISADVFDAKIDFKIIED